MKDLVLVSVGPKRTNVTKLIREKTGLPLGKCTSLLRSTPATVASSLEDHVAMDFKLFLESLGAEVRLVDVEQKTQPLKKVAQPLLKGDVFDEVKNPDFISSPIKNLEPEVWDRGYYCETADGVWYEVYVSQTIKGYYPTIDLSIEEDFDSFGGFNDLFLGNYEQYGQITFFVPKNESVYTLDELTDILI